MFKSLITGFTAAVFLVGCATSIPRGEATRSGIDAALTEASLPPVTPAEVQAALLPEVGVELPDPAASEERFDVNTDSTPARAFFMALVKGTHYNMVVHPKVGGKISLAMIVRTCFLSGGPALFSGTKEGGPARYALN